MEIPALEFLRVEDKDLDEFDMYDEDANLYAGSSVYLSFRKPDGRRFEFTKFDDLYGAIKRNRAYLQET